jgi:phytoene synthase
LKRGRLYVPRELLVRFGVPEWDLNAGRVSEGFKALMAELVRRTRDLYDRGRPLCDRVGRELRFEMRLTWLGGSRILDRIEAAGYDVFRRRPRLTVLDKAALAWRAWRWS